MTGKFQALLITLNIRSIGAIIYTRVRIVTHSKQVVNYIALCKYFDLQDREQLDGNLNLAEHTVQIEGLVQIHLELKHDPLTGRGKINIVDVIKPGNEDMSVSDEEDHHRIQNCSETS